MKYRQSGSTILICDITILKVFFYETDLYVLETNAYLGVYVGCHT